MTLQRLNSVCIVTFIGLIYFWPCGSQVLSVSSIDKAIITSTDRIALYALPRTVFEVRCYITSHQQVVGPYASYAREFLGRDGIQQAAVRWTIDSVSVVPVTVFDPSQVYVVKFGKKFDYHPLEELSQRGFIIFPLDNRNATYLPDSVQYPSNELAEWSVLDLPFTTNVSDTTYQIVIKDSVVIRQPVVKSRGVLVSQYERAKELARQIQQIHQRRMELILDADDPVPTNEKTLQWMIDQLKHKEEAYLQLFLGRSVSRTYLYSWRYVPSGIDKTLQAVEIFRFSPHRGVSTKNDATAVPVTITVEPQNTIAPLRDYQSLFTSLTIPCIFYRVPEIANISVAWGNRELTRQPQQIYQLGALVPWLPANR